MSLIKKIDVAKHFAARRAMVRAAPRPVIRPLGARVSDAEPADAKANAAKFIEDFSLEHSSSSVHVPPKE
jgi:hypothetical protein